VEVAEIHGVLRIPQVAVRNAARITNDCIAVLDYSYVTLAPRIGTTMKPTQINIQVELERIGWTFERGGNDEWKVCCPIHDDKNPSASINIETQKWYCQVCHKGGNFISFIAYVSRTSYVLAHKYLSKWYNLRKDKPIDPDRIERAHKRIWKHSTLLAELRKRGVTDELIRQYRLGVEDERVTIPIKNEDGIYVNIKSYLPGAPGPEKMFQEKGFATPRLTPIDQLQYDTVIVTGGEMKAYVGAAQLNPHDMGCITSTGGEGHWDPAWNELFRGKNVGVCMDIDKVGQVKNVNVATHLYGTADEVRILTLPLDPEKYPTGDINDFIAQEHGDLKQLYDESPVFIPGKDFDLPKMEPIDCVLKTQGMACVVGQRFRWEALVMGQQAEPSYAIPARIRANCEKRGPHCVACKISSRRLRDVTEFIVDPEAPVNIEMPGGKVTDGDLKDALGIPRKCNTVSLEVLEHRNATMVSMQTADTINLGSDIPWYPACVIDNSLEPNEIYQCIGTHGPDRTGRGTLLVSEATPIKNTLASYTNTRPPEFWLPIQPRDDSLAALQDRIHSINEDLAANVTKMHNRHRLQDAIELTAFSAERFNFGRELGIKAWIDSVIISNTMLGKTETALRMQKFYNWGSYVDCKCATLAGLLAGCQKVGGRWYITWGVIARYDRQFVILDEFKGLSREICSALTATRSNGKIINTKIAERVHLARTRLIVLSNPRDEFDMGSFNYGIEAIRQVVGNAEDVRRFDFGMILSKVLSDGLLPTVPQLYTSEIAHENLLWGVTRTPEQIRIHDEQQIVDLSKDLQSRYSTEVQLVDSYMHLKLARLAAACAIRIHSTKDGETVEVLPCHAQWAYDFLREQYDSPESGYLQFTKDRIKKSKVENIGEVTAALTCNVPHPDALIGLLLQSSVITSDDIMHFAGWNHPNMATQLVGTLRRNNALEEVARFKYCKTSAFTALLKTLQPEPIR
jgi:hypothetical protein